MTIEQQQQERAEQKAAAIQGLRLLLAALETDEKSYAVMTCHGAEKDDYGIEWAKWELGVVWGSAAALYKAEDDDQPGHDKGGSGAWGDPFNQR